MKKETKLISAALFIIGMGLAITGIYLYHLNFIMINTGWVAVVISWIICIVNIAKDKTINRTAWILFMVFCSSIAIPVYLIKIKTKGSK